MKLYGCTGRSDRIKAAAGWAGVPLEVVAPFVMGVDNKTPEFLAKNPFGKVPVLETPDGTCIFESNAIARFLVSSTPCSLYPADAAARAHRRLVRRLQRPGLRVGPQWYYPIAGAGADARNHPRSQSRGEAKTTVENRPEDTRARVDRVLPTSPAIGSSFTLADVVGACALQNVYSALYAPADWNAFPARFSRGSSPCSPPWSFVDAVGVVPKCETAMAYDAGPPAMPRPTAPAAGEPQVRRQRLARTRIRQTFIDFFEQGPARGCPLRPWCRTTTRRCCSPTRA